MVDVESDYALQAGAQGLLEPLDYTVIDRSKLDPRFVSGYAAGSFYHSFVLGSNPSAFPEAPKRADVSDHRKRPALIACRLVQRRATVGCPCRLTSRERRQQLTHRSD